LSNVRKHSQAKQVSLEVSMGAEWRFVVGDNGLGFSGKSPLGQTTHVGMKITQERAARIGATVQVQSEFGQGTAVLVTLPAHPVSRVRLGTLHLDAGVLVAMEWDNPATAR
jgi:two-component system nitrate/nitrite sensor histidine kinase NarX